MVSTSSNHRPRSSRPGAKISKSRTKFLKGRIEPQRDSFVVVWIVICVMLLIGAFYLWTKYYSKPLQEVEAKMQNFVRLYSKIAEYSKNDNFLTSILKNELNKSKLDAISKELCDKNKYTRLKNELKTSISKIGVEKFAQSSIYTEFTNTASLDENNNFSATCQMISDYSTDRIFLTYVILNTNLKIAQDPLDNSNSLISIFKFTNGDNNANLSTIYLANDTDCNILKNQIDSIQKKYILKSPEIDTSCLTNDTFLDFPLPNDIATEYYKYPRWVFVAIIKAVKYRSNMILIGDKQKWAMLLATFLIYTNKLAPSVLENIYTTESKTNVKKAIEEWSVEYLKERIGDLSLTLNTNSLQTFVQNLSQKDDVVFKNAMIDIFNSYDSRGKIV